MRHCKFNAGLNTPVAIASVIVATAVMVFIFHPQDPVFRDKSPSYWLDELGAANPRPEVWNLLNSAGPDAVPVLMRTIERNDSVLRRLYRDAFPRLPAVIKRFLPAPRPRDLLLTRMSSVAMSLGSSGLSILARLFHDADPKVQLMALDSFGEMTIDKTQAIPVLIDLLKNDEFRVRGIAAEFLGQIGPPARAATPELTRSLIDTNAQVQVNAAVALWQINHDTSGLPVIVRNPKAWRPLEVLRTLGEMGPGAKEAAPAVLAFISDWERMANVPFLGRGEYARIRECAREALSKIGPNTDPVKMLVP